jgi:hypothetical protein
MVIKKKYKERKDWKNDTGRPTKYKEEYCNDIVKYFETCQAEILVDVKFFQANKNNPISKILNPLADEKTEEELKTLNAASVKSIDQKLVMNRFPTFIRYWLRIDVNEDTMLDWDKKYPKFLGARKKCKQIQEAILLENWLQWTYNSQFAQFILKNNHWYKDKSEVETTMTILSENELTD